MQAKDLSGMTFGTLYVDSFDARRHEEDTMKRLAGEIDRVRRYYTCRCLVCGRLVSVRGENLVSGNTKGCGCDAYKKSGDKRHSAKINRYELDEENGCYTGYANNTGIAFQFDIDDYDIVSKYCWYETADGYIMTRLNKHEQIFLHRLVCFGYSANKHAEFVDHINRVRTDCRKCNLRTCTPQENAWNRTVRHDSQSGVSGVRLYEPTGKWNAYIHVGGKWKSLGYYETKEQAVLARKKCRKDDPRRIFAAITRYSGNPVPSRNGDVRKVKRSGHTDF